MANKRALIVDDSTTAQYRLKKMLRAYALDIDVADSGEAALRYLATNVPDVVFMDHTMPGMDGLRALQVIKSHPETAVIPVIMYTSQSGDVYTGQARALGALDVVSKDKINATDLSKVMEAIHIYPIDKAEKVEAEKAGPKTKPVAKIEEAPKIERRTATSAAAEQIRNLDYRLSHLEQLQEDNRRFIVARILREIQGLRQTLKQEFANIPQVAPVIPPVEEPDKTSSFTGFTFLLMLILLVMGFFLVHLTIELNKNSENQIIIQSELNKLANRNISSTNKSVTLGASNSPQNNYLSDLVWIFNQHAQLEFNQNNIDIKPLISLQDLLNRLTTSGFTGNALITISVGNFCNTLNETGEAQLAKPETSLNSCIFSNEIYSIERLVDEYSYQAHLIMNNIIRNNNGNLTIMINAQEGKDPYPDKTLITTAGEWNRIAARNNRIDLVLLPE